MVFGLGLSDSGQSREMPGTPHSQLTCKYFRHLLSGFRHLPADLAEFSSNQPSSRPKITLKKLCVNAAQRAA